MARSSPHDQSRTRRHSRPSSSRYQGWDKGLSERVPECGVGREPNGVRAPAWPSSRKILVAQTWDPMVRYSPDTRRPMPSISISIRARERALQLLSTSRGRLPSLPCALFILTTSFPIAVHAATEDHGAELFASGIVSTTDHDELTPTFSPDGQRLVIVRRSRGGTFTLVELRREDLGWRLVGPLPFSGTHFLRYPRGPVTVLRPRRQAPLLSGPTTARRRPPADRRSPAGRQSMGGRGGW
jgi:hypothetical protein